VQAVTRETDPVRLGLFNDAGINAIRAFTSRGIRIFGARTLVPDPDHRLLNVRRTLIQLRRALLHGLAWVPFEPDNFRLRAMLRGALEAFLEDYWRRGALAGATRAEAFAVSFDPAAEGTLTINIGVAPVSPAEFVYLTLTRSDEAITASEPTAATEQGT
jgi:phage tail sheath protein FI